MIVTGFAGPARVGKTAITNELVKVAVKAGWRVEVMPFAGPLKREATERGFGKEDNPEGYRKFCQEHGAEMRAQDENHWLDQWNADLVKLRNKHWEDDGDGPLLIIADDVRYENEQQAIRGNGGGLVFLHPGERMLEEADAAWRTHESEMLANTMIGNTEMCTELFDYVMYNDKSDAKLKAWAASYFSLIVNFAGSPEQVCECEGCRALLENRPASVDTLLKDLEDLMDDMNKPKDDDEEGDDDDE